MQHPEKWRDTLDPFALPFHTVTLTEVLGYPHAGNDVFHVRGLHEGREVEAYIKAARHQEADLRRETDLLLKLDVPEAPRVLDWDEDYRWLVTEARSGRRLSLIVGSNEDQASLGYMAAWGEKLAQLHGLKGDFPDAPHRRFMDIPDAERCRKLGLEDVRAWLETHQPEPGMPCFCHGDFHYANLLWEKGRISAVLDLELSGLGDREFDMAWAIIRRPGQKFMTTDEEVQRFLKGYQRREKFDSARLRWYMVNAYAWFCGIDAEDTEYTAWVKTWLRREIRRA